MHITRRTSTLPVTALKFYGDLLLCGEGPNLSTYKYSLSTHISTIRVFEYERIHGIVTQESSQDDDSSYIAVFGGKSCCVLNLDNDSLEWKRVVCCQFDDWIWTAQWLCKEDCIALAFGHNAVCLWNWNDNQVETMVHCEDKSILYSAHFIGDSWSELVLAAGTVFNQVVLWAADDCPSPEEKCPVLHRLTGHTGVIFSIKYNTVTREFCSVSDDRSIIIWQVEFQSEFNCWRSAKFHQKHRLFGHSARVWDVRLLSSGETVSIGEDSSCIVWNALGKITQKFKGHRGKSIWSVDVNLEESVVATGGGDCSIRVWKLPSVSSNTDNEELQKTCNLSDEDQNLAHSSVIKPDGCPTFFPRTVRLYGGCNVAVMSDDGILHGYDSGAWNVLLQDKKYNSYSILEVCCDGKYIAVGSICGNLSILNNGDLKVSKQIYSGKVFSIIFLKINKSWNESGYQILTTGPDGKLNLWNLSESQDKSVALVSSQSFVLPPGKQRWVSAACVVPEEDLLVCGDRGGSVHVYSLNDQNDCEPVQNFWKIHGKTGVTSICFYDNHLYTSGRDGYYRQYSIDNNRLHLLNSSKVLKGFDWISRLEFKEGDFQVLGFHSNNFVVHSVDRNQTLMSFPCGGGHRAWDFSHQNDVATFVHIKNREVIINTKMFVDKQHQVLNESLHGRELTCVRHIHSSLNLDFCVTCSEDTFLNLLTLNGSEVKVTHRLHGHISSVRTVAVANCRIKEDEVSYVLFSGGGRAQLKTWRVIINLSEDPKGAANYDESLNYQQIGSYMLGYKGRKRGKPWKHQMYDVSPETRLMDLSAFSLSELVPNATDLYVVAAACSDGNIRVFLYDLTHREFRLIGESSYHDHCVLCIKHVILTTSTCEATKEHKAPEKQCMICSSATDGKIAFWDVTELLHSVIDSNLDETKDHSCDTKSKLEKTFKELGARKENSTCQLEDPVFVIPCHQSGINALDVFHVKGNRYLVASGGDDNCLAVHSVALAGAESYHSFSVAMEAAHSTQITGVKMFDPNHILSTSIDQRLSVWKVEYPLRKITLSCCKFIDIADVSSMNVWTRKDQPEYQVAIAGVGIQTLEVSL